MNNRRDLADDAAEQGAFLGDNHLEREGKYPIIGPDQICQGFQLAVCTTIVGGLCCSLTCIIGEGILKNMQYHKNNLTIKDTASTGLLGGAVTNLVLYITILMYACKLDPKRKQFDSRSKIGAELIFGDNTENMNHPCYALLVLLSIHVANMFASGAVGYWIYTRHNNHDINFQSSTESLAVGIAVSMLPLCISNFCLLSAYGNFRYKSQPLPPINLPAPFCSIVHPLSKLCPLSRIFV